MAEGKNETRTLKVGDEAPDFGLKDHNRQDFKLSAHRGKNVVLNFFPAAFSGVCSQQMPRIEEQKAMFGDDTVVVGISVDNQWSQLAWANQLGVGFPLLSDFYPHGAVAEKYGVLLPNGVAERAVIGIDKEGKIRYINVNPMLEVPDLTPCAIALEKTPA
jgi:peroxiredoxin